MWPLTVLWGDDGTESDGSSYASGSSNASLTEDLPPVVTPDKIQRRCTDVPWAVAYFLGLSLLVGLGCYSAGHSDRTRLLALKDFEGSVCGQGAKQFKPFLFFCAKSPTELDLEHPICLASCPTDAASSHLCYSKATDDWVNVSDHGTAPTWPGRLCWPQTEDLMRQQQAWIARHTRLLDLVRTVYGAWQPLAVSAACAIVVSMLWINILRERANFLAWIGLRVLIVVVWGWAIYLHFKYHSAAFFPCLVLLFTGLVFLCIARRQSYDIDRATICIEVACQCVVDVPMLRIGPALDLAFWVVVIWYLSLNLTQIFSSVYWDPSQETLRVASGEFSPSGRDIACLAFWAFMALWVHNFVTACWEFCIVYVAQIWYFSGGAHSPSRVPTCVALKSLWALHRYHLGTVALAALVIGLTRPFRFCLRALTSGARVDGNPLSCIIGECCCCLVDLYNGYLARVSAIAYMDVSLRSSSLFEGLHNAFDVSQAEKETESALHLSTFFFQMVGVVFMWWMGHFLTYAMVHGFLPGCGEFADPRSGLYVAFPYGWCFAGGTSAAVCAWPFMMVIGKVSDTILYCTTIERLAASSGGDEKPGIFGYFEQMLTAGTDFFNPNSWGTRGLVLEESPEEASSTAPTGEAQTVS